MFNILTDTCIRVKRSNASISTLTLPETYATLMADEVDAFPALRPHQRHAWHAFLVQLGVMAMHNDGISEPPIEANEWQRVIRGLTPDFPDDEPWQLVVDDITKPAFMQPPASSNEKLADYKNTVTAPDELDMLVTSKNHDLKSTTGMQGDAGDWLFALITLQTMEGFMGAGNHGISRMNGGASSRPAFSITPWERVGAHVRRDISALLPHHISIAEQFSMSDDGVSLLWVIPWDGAKSEALIIGNLTPFYIDICRRIRLGIDNQGELFGMRSTSKSARVDAKALKGRTGDPWTPINTKEGKSLTLARGGFTYKRIVDYLTNADWERPELLKPTQSDPDDVALVARAMVRGQGKTEGYYERIIPISHKVKSAMMGRASTQELGDIAKARIDDVGKVQRILRHAVSVFAAGGEDSISDEHRSRANPWSDRLDEIVDATFFEDLQDEFEADNEDDRKSIRDKWLLDNGNKDGVIDSARKILRDAEDALPCNEIRRYKARVRADSVFEGRIRSGSGFPALFPRN
jgi:CRISPR system Cascade subunit CasA